MQILRKIAVPALAISLIAGSYATGHAENVKIGNIIPLSGPSATLGQQGKAAREMAVEEINAAGGIKSLGGAKFELVFADSESKPEKGVAEAERLINTEKVTCPYRLLEQCCNLSDDSSCRAIWHSFCRAGIRF